MKKFYSIRMPVQFNLALLNLALLILVSSAFNISIIHPAFANQLEIINLNHRPAKELIPILEPLIDKNGSISGEKYVLFIRTSYKNFQQIKEALITLDADFRQLSINIMQESATTMKQYGFKVSKDNKKTNAKVYSTQHSASNPKQQTIQVTEGQWATLQTGMSIPSISRSKNPNGTITESIQYKTILSKLKIHPVINGDKINIKIKSFTGSKDSINSGTTQGINTSVTGKLGEWIALGGITSANNNSASGFVFSTKRTSDSSQQIFIKIDITKYQE